MSTEKKSYVLPIAIMFLLFFMIAFVTGFQNPMGVIVKNEFGASNFLSQLGNLANFIAYAFMGIPAGIMLTKIGYKKTALAAVIIGFVGVGITFLSGAASSFSVYLIGAFISGFSMCLLNTVVNPMLNTLGGGGSKGNQLLQFGGAINSIGATLAPVLVGYLMGTIVENRTISSANPALFIAMAIFALAFLILISFKIPEPHIEAAKAVKETDKHSALSFRHFIFGIIAIFVYVGCEVGIPNIGNLYMTQQLLIDPAVAGTIVGTYWFLMLCGRLFGGLIGAKVTSKTMVTVVSSAAILFILVAVLSPETTMVRMPVFQSDISFGLVQVPIGVMFLALCGLCTSIMWGGIFNLSVEGLGKYTATASGIFMVMVCGGGILPAIQGGIADVAGYLPSYWLVVAGFAYILFFALVGSKNVNKDIVTE